MTGSTDPTPDAPYLTLFSLFKSSKSGEAGQVDVVILRGGISIRPRVHVKESKSKPFCDSSKYLHIRNGRRLPCRAVFFFFFPQALKSVCAALLALHASFAAAALGISLT